MNKLRRRFWKNEDGAFAIMFAVGAFALLTAVGVAIDISRLGEAKSQSQDAVDAAVLAAAKIMQETGDKKQAKDAARAAYVSNLGNHTMLDGYNLRIQFRENGTTIEANADTKLATTFMAMAGKKDLNISTQAIADIGINSRSDMEIALVMDMSTSMCGSGTSGCGSSPKLDAAKQAASDLIDTVILDDQSEYSTRAAVIPFGLNLRISPDSAPDPFVQTLTELPPDWSGWRQHCTEWVPASSSSEQDYVSCANYETIYSENQIRTNCISDRYFKDTNSLYAGEEPPGPGYYFHALLGDRFPVSQDSANTPLEMNRGLVAEDPTYTRTYNPDYGLCWNPS